MPWTADDATAHTKKATSPEEKEKWAKIANSVLEETADEGRAIRVANAAVKDDSEKDDDHRNKRS